MKITAADMDKRRLTPEQVTKLCRETILGQKMIVNDEEGLRFGFGLILSGIEITPAAKKRIWALVGTVHGKGYAVNGVPLFLDCQFLHMKDRDAVLVELTRMREALGFPSDKGDR